MSTQGPEEVLTRLKRVTAAAMRTNPRPEARQRLQELFTDLESLERKLQELPAAGAPKPGEGKEVLEVAVAGVALLMLLTYLVVQACMEALSRQCYEALMQSDAGAQIANAWSTIAIMTYLQWTALMGRLRTEEGRLRNEPPCFRPNFNCCLAALEFLHGVAGGSDPSLPILPTNAELLQAFNLLQTCLTALVRCLDPADSTGAFNRLVGPNGVVTTTIQRLRYWLAPNMNVTRPGVPPAPPLRPPRLPGR